MDSVPCNSEFNPAPLRLQTCSGRIVPRGVMPFMDSHHPQSALKSISKILRWSRETIRSQSERIYFFGDFIPIETSLVSLVPKLRLGNRHPRSSASCSFHDVIALMPEMTVTRSGASRKCVPKPELGNEQIQGCTFTFRATQTLSLNPTHHPYPGFERRGRNLAKRSILRRIAEISSIERSESTTQH